MIRVRLIVKLTCFVFRDIRFQNCGFAAAHSGKALPYRELRSSFAARLSLAGCLRSSTQRESRRLSALCCGRAARASTNNNLARSKLFI